MAPPLTVAPSPEETLASQYEQQNVHEVYNLIATHFSATRYKQWPSITKFLHSLRPGSLGLDAGCGNGKYLPAWDADAARAMGCYMLGFDRSDKLLELARRCGYEPGQEGLREAIVADVLDLGGVRPGSMDFAISIATLHHISLAPRRLQTVRTFLRALAPTHGRGMIYVWALEQSKESRRHAPGEDLERGEGGEQDVFVPWVMSKEAPKSTKDALAGVRKEKTRRPQKAKKGTAGPAPRPPAAHPSTAADSVTAAVGSVVEAVTEKLSALPAALSSTAPSQEPAPTAAASAPPPPPPDSPPKVYQRYYHLFRAAELADLIASAAEAEGLLYLPLLPADESPADQLAREERERAAARGRNWVRLEQEYWERDNWVCVLERGRS